MHHALGRRHEGQDPLGLGQELTQVGGGVTEAQDALPGHVDGRENVYYGVAPRYEPRQAETDTDRGDAVNLATSLWLDEITRPAPDLPPFSWMVETSMGKVQAGYFLEEPTANLERVEHLNQRLGIAGLVPVSLRPFPAWL